MTKPDTTSEWMIHDLGPDENIPYDLLLEADPSKARVDSYIRSNICRVLSCAGLGAPLGVYVLRINSGTAVETECDAEILNISVSKNSQGTGLGKLLILDAIRVAQANGVRALSVGTGNSSISQIAFYQKCGFRITGVDPDYFARKYDEKIFENGLWCRDLILMTMAI